MAEPTEISKLLNDREFHDLPIADKLKLLRDNYPDYAQLNAKDQGQLLNEYDAKVRPVTDSSGNAGPIRSFIDRTPAGPVLSHAEGIGTALSQGDYWGALKHAANVASGGMSDWGEDALNMGKRALEHGKAAMNGEGAQHALYAIPGVGGMAEQAAEDAKSGNTAGLLGTGLTLAAAGGSGVPAGRLGAAARGAAREGFAVPRVVEGGKIVDNHLGLIDRGIKAAHGAQQGWESTAPTVTAPGGYFPSDNSHIVSAPAEAPLQVPPVAPNVERVTGKLSVPSTAGYPQPQAAAEPFVTQVPGKPAPIPANHPLAQVQDLGPEAPIEKPPGGTWGKGYRATKAPQVEAPYVPPVTQVPGKMLPTPVDHPLAKLTEPPAPVEQVRGSLSVPSTAGYPQAPNTTKIPSVIPPVEVPVGGDALRTDAMQIPARYKTRNNPSAAHNVDQRIAGELKAQGVTGKQITEQHVQNAKNKLGHLRATPKLEDIRATMREMGIE